MSSFSCCAWSPAHELRSLKPKDLLVWLRDNQQDEIAKKLESKPITGQLLYEYVCDPEKAFSFSERYAVDPEVLDSFMTFVKVPSSIRAQFRGKFTQKEGKIYDTAVGHPDKVSSQPRRSIKVSATSEKVSVAAARKAVDPSDDLSLALSSTDKRMQLLNALQGSDVFQALDEKNSHCSESASQAADGPVIVRGIKKLCMNFFSKALKIGAEQFPFGSVVVSICESTVERVQQVRENQERAQELGQYACI